MLVAEPSDYFVLGSSPESMVGYMEEYSLLGMVREHHHVPGALATMPMGFPMFEDFHYFPEDNGKW
jgi:hypothetical protein